MSKRGADEYITKDHGSTPSSAADSAPVKMATAAQMAKRKMAVPKSRLGSGRGPPASPFNPANSNPFGQTTQAPSQQQQTFPSTNGAVTFGATQSFPPSTSGSNSSFNFQVPQAQSFTFGSTSTTTNPFATVNGSANTDTNSNEDAVMESPQKKSTFGSTFGQPNNNTNGGAGFLFGQSAQQPSGNTFNFGGAGKANDVTPAGGLFSGISKPEEPKQNNPFGLGAPVQPPFAGFGTGSSGSGSQPPSSSFGTTASQASVFGFGKPPTSTSATPVNGFGAVGNPVSQAATSGFSFGQTQTSAPAQNALTRFGSRKADEPTQTPSLFGQSTTSQPPSTLFSKPTTSDALQLSTTETKPSAAPANPFAGLFASKSPSPSPSSGGTPTEESKAPVFNFGNPSSTSGGLFGAPATAAPSSNNVFGSMSRGSEPAASTPVSFGTTNTFQSRSETAKVDGGSEIAPTLKPAPVQSTFNFPTTQPPSSGGMFSFGKQTTTNTPGTQSLSSKPNDTPPAEQSAPLHSKPASQTQDLFGSRPSSETAKPSPSETPQAPVWGGGKLFDKPIQAPAAEKPASSSMPLSGSISKTDRTPVSSERKPDTTEKLNFQSSNARPTTSIEVGSESNPKRTVFTKSPARIPNYLNGEGYKEYDNNFRLRSLNREFQRRIATLDPQVHDFENLIRHYVAARDSIGASLGLYTRNVAGTKRKNDDGIDEERDIPPQYKRARPTEAGDTTISEATSSVPNFVPTAPKQPATAETPSPAKTAAPSRATEVFKSMIPTSPSKSTNVFASLSPAPPMNFGQTNNPKQPELSKSAAVSTTPTRSPPKKPAFEMPKPAAGGGFLAFGAIAAPNAKEFEKELMEKRKLDEFDSDEDDETTFNKQYEEEQRKKKAKLESIAKTGFTPSFGGANTSSYDKPAFSFGSNSASQSNGSTASTPAFSGFGGFKPAAGATTFGTQTSSTFPGFKAAAEAGKLVTDPVSISDEADEEEDDDDEEGDEEGEDSEYQQDDDAEDEEDDEDELAEDEVPSGDSPDDDDDNDLQASMINNRNKGKSLFERIEPPQQKQSDKTPVSGENKENEPTASGFNFGSPIMQSAKNQSFKPSLFGSHIGKSTPDAPGFSPITPTTTASASNEPYKPATTFNFTPTPPTSSTPVDGASIFSGGAVTSTPTRFEGMFGSRPSTPSNIDKSNIFGQSGTSTPVGDHTWKPGSEIKFDTPNKSKGAPSLSITAPSPGREDSSKALGNLFGNAAPPARPAESSTHLGFNFGGPTSNPAPGYLVAASHLAGASGTSSGFSSRATSPGLTDNESVATNETDEATNDPQTSLMDSRAGEENEDCVWESRAKAIKFFPKGSVPKGSKFKENEWNTMGLGILRVLTDKDTGKTRVVLRAEPGASIVINENLIPGIKYEQEPQGKSKGGATKFPIVEHGKIERWVLKVKTDEMAKQLTELLEANKGA